MIATAFGIARRAAPLALLIGASAGVSAQETVQVTVPAGVSFSVTDIASPTTGAPAPTVVTYSGGTWPPPNGRRFRVLLQADTSAFTPPSGGSIPANRVSWTASTGNGNAFNNTLVSTAYRLVYRSPTNTPAGSVSVTWQLAALTGIANLRAGAHTLTARWRVELQ